VKNTLETKRIKSEWIIAAIIRSEAGNGANIEEMSEKFLKMSQDVGDIGSIRLREVPNGYYSEDIDRFVTKLFLFGYSTERSPSVRLTREGIDLCDKLIRKGYEEVPNEIKKIAKALNLDLNEILEK
jgi:hypothetical protein